MKLRIMIMTLFLVLVLSIIFYGNHFMKAYIHYEKESAQSLVSIRFVMDEGFKDWSDGKISRREFAELIEPYIKEVEALRSKYQNKFNSKWFFKLISKGDLIYGENLRLNTIITLDDIVRGYTYANEKIMTDEMLKNIYPKRNKKFYERIEMIQMYYELSE